MSALEDAAAVLAGDVGQAHATVLEACVAERRWWLEQWPDGAAYLVCLLAQDVQERIRETDTLWPVCPEHGDHPLFVEPDLGTDPFWVCERSGLPIAPVGSLP